MTTAIGYLFPGQGSQKQGMFLPYQNEPLTQKIFAAAKSALGFDLEEICTHGSADDLKQTAIAQPAILTLSYIVWSLFKQKFPNHKPHYAAGHSLGEYTALLTAGVMSYEEAVFLVYNRGKLMQQVCPSNTGTMAAILGKDEATLKKLCQEEAQGDVLTMANFNAPGQIVVAGNKAAIERLLKKTKGVLLEVSVAFHCSLLDAMLDPMAKILDQVQYKNPAWPIVANTNNQLLTEKEQIKSNLLAQITSPVLWQSGIEWMSKQNCNHFFEFGAGKILANLNKRIDKNLQTINFDSPAAVEQFVLTP